MATSLQTQLAQIAAKSTNPLDLKAQRKAHSQSLFFEPKEAASQDFETLYDICIEGFRGLCRVDSRFVRYSHTIFSVQSKNEDRTQLTAVENEKLDALLEEFLSLLGGFLLLKPALKATEWLIRRFRIHELNTQATILTFLPYHLEPFFTTLLSILPPKLPQPLRFVTQFRQSSLAIPRESIVLASIQSPPFFTLLNKHLIQNARQGFQYPKLTEFWSSIVSESLAGQVDVAASGSTQARRQKEDDIILRILPTLNDGLSTEDPSICRACYIVLMVLVVKFQLSDKAIEAMEEAVGERLSPSFGESELVCLAVLAESRIETRLPKKTIRSLLKIKYLSDKIGALTQRYDVQKLVLGIIYGILDRLGKQETYEGLLFVRQAIERGYLSQENAGLAIRAVVEAADNVEYGDKALPDVREQVAEMTLQLANSDSVGTIVKSKIRELRPEAEAALGLVDSAFGKPKHDSGSESEADTHSKYSFLESIGHIPSQLETSSFLSNNSFESKEQKVLLDICKKAGSSTSNWSKLGQIPPFKDQDLKSGQLSLTILMRFWCGNDAPAARSLAMVLAADIMKRRIKNYREDQQFILPYAIVGLSDPSKSIRRAAADLVATIHQSHSDVGGVEACFGRSENLYGHDDQNYQNIFADAKDAATLSGTFVERLEECKLDEAYASKVFWDYLQGGGSLASPPKSSMSFAEETAIVGLTTHIVLTPFLLVRRKLLAVLRDVGKVRNKSKTSLILPLVQEISEMDTQELESRCLDERMSAESYIEEVIETLSATNKEGIKMVIAIIQDHSKDSKKKLKIRSLQHVKKAWPRMRPDSHRRLAHAILDTVWDDSTEIEVQETAGEVLSSVSIHSDILCEFIDSLPALFGEAEESLYTNKRRKTDTGYMDGSLAEVDPSTVAILQQWSFVLELVENGQEETTVSLISRLCALLNDVHASVATSKGQASYTQSLLLETCNKSLGKISNGKTSVNPNIVPIDTIIEIFQTSASTQVQRSALTLISTLAKMFPEVIIHHIMPVFTRMGQSILQNADEYSIHITDTAIQSIIPPLLASFHEQKGGSQEGIVRLLLSFVAAFEHVPLYRRLPLFSSLVEQVGPSSSLHLLIVLFVTKFGKGKIIDDFVCNLVSRYSTVDQLSTVDKTVKLLLNATSEYPSPFSSQILPSDDTRSFTMSMVRIIGILSLVLEDKTLVGRAAQELSKDGNTLRKIYSSVSEEILKLSASSSSQKRLSDAANGLLDSILKSLPVHESIAGLEVLLSGGEDDILRRTLSSIEKRAREVGASDSASQAACLELLPTLSQLLKTKEDDALIKTCLACLDSIIERFGKKDPILVLGTLEAVVSSKLFISHDKQTVEMSVLCTASAVQALGEEVVPLLPRAIPLALEAMRNAVAPSPNSAVVNASYSFFATILDGMPWAVSKMNVEEILLLSADVASDETLSVATTENRAAVLEVLAKRTTCRDILSSISKTWAGAIQLEQNASGKNGSRIRAALQHLQSIRAVIDANGKSNVMRHGQLMIDFFLQVLELPSQHVQSRVSLTTSEVEEIVLFAADCMVAMVYKLNDAAFRPLFSSLVEWANAGSSKAGSSQITRQYALYIFLVRFFGTLKSIVTSYMSSVIGESTVLLTQEQPSADASDSERYYEHRLWCCILETLRHALDNDADEYFQASSRFTPLCSALTAQLENIRGLSTRVPTILQNDHQQAVLEGHVIPTIVSLASAADAAENTKTLNRELLKHLRSGREEVRSSVVRSQQMLVEKLGEDWLANLPEMLPAISEVLEDEDEEVMGEARKWVTAVENVLGESLEGMLQ